MNVLNSHNNKSAAWQVEIRFNADRIKKLFVLVPSTEKNKKTKKLNLVGIIKHKDNQDKHC